MTDLFHPPVRIEWGHKGQVRSVKSSREVAELLMDDRWPRSAERLRACETAIAHYDGRATIQEVRITFEDAARDAHFLIEKSC